MYRLGVRVVGGFPPTCSIPAPSQTDGCWINTPQTQLKDGKSVSLETQVTHIPCK